MFSFVKKFISYRDNLYVFLTDKGKELTERAAQEFLRLEDSALVGIDEHEKEPHIFVNLA